MPASRKRILVVLPDRAQYRLSFLFLEQATAHLAELRSVSNVNFALDEIEAEVAKASLIVVDVTETGPAAMYVLGYAHAANRPVLMIYESAGRLPFDVTTFPAFRYSLETQEAFPEVVIAKIREALDHPSKFQGRVRDTPLATSIFISYSHKDAEFLERLRVHLRPLEKAQRIVPWDDQKIQAGQFWKAEIEKALKHAKAAILLVSADFLASDFANDNEVPILLQKAESDGTHIIPVILKACRFLRDPRLNRFQAINDPSKPLAELPGIEQERIYEKISQLVESFSS